MTDKMQQIERSELSKGYSISKVVMGCWQLSGSHGTPVAPEALIGDFNRSVDGGITTFDCADIYSGVEDLLGNFRRQCKVPIQIHTKFVPDRDVLGTINKEYVQQVIDRSLQRLAADCLDLVQFHWWDFSIPHYVQTAQWLGELQEAGKIKNLGVTNFDASHLNEIVNSGVKVVSNQVQYSLLDARPENLMVQFCKNYNIKLLCYGTLAGGFLSSRYQGRAEPKEPLENRSLVKYKLIIDDVGGWDALQNLLDTIARVAKKYATSVSNIATRFVLEKSEVAGVIVGYSRSGKIHDTLGVFDFCLDTDDYCLINDARSKFQLLLGDIYSLERIPGGRHSQIMRYNLNAK